jgi:glycosyltransferase involved in cell wall biosynthesis
MPIKKTYKDTIKNKRLGYLSAAIRVSTDPCAEASGPRSHVLGVIQAFRDLGWQVFPYIVGDRISRKITYNSEMRMEKSFIIRFAADIVRLISGLIHSILAWVELHRKVDLVYERFAVLQSLGWIFQFEKKPWILETSGLYFYEASTERKSIVLIPIARVFEIWAYRQCDVLICVTDALKELIIEETGISAEKVLVISNGVDCVRFNRENLLPIRIFSGPTIGFVSALIRWHGLDLLIEALGQLQKEGIVINLVVTGDGPMRAEWEAQAQQLGLSKNIIFLGQVSWEIIPAYIAGFDLGYVGNIPMEIGVMYHSPLKLYEYMAMELPVIAAENDDSRDMLINGKTGYLFSAGNKEELIRVIRIAYEDKKHWRIMGKRARKQVLLNASWSSRVQTMIDSFDQIQMK